MLRLSLGPRLRLRLELKLTRPRLLSRLRLLKLSRLRLLKLPGKTVDIRAGGDGGFSRSGLALAGVRLPIQKIFYVGKTRYKHVCMRELAQAYPKGT